jgi:hypothetical protein
MISTNFICVQFKKLFAAPQKLIPTSEKPSSTQPANGTTTDSFSFCFLSSTAFFSFTASVSVRNLRNIPKVPLTVKPDPNDTLSRSLNGSNTNNYYYDNNNYAKPSDEMSAMYMNGQAQHQQHQDPLQHQYAVVKKNGSKRDIRENLERENSAIFKVKREDKAPPSLSISISKERFILRAPIHPWMLVHWINQSLEAPTVDLVARWHEFGIAFGMLRSPSVPPLARRSIK